MSDSTARLEAPCDVFVEKVLVFNGTITAGQLLMKLRSPLLERLLGRVDTHSQHLIIAERPFHDGRADEEISGLIKKKDALGAALQATQEILDIKRKEDALLQTTSKTEIIAAERDVASATTAMINAELLASHAERKKQDMIDKLKIAKEALAHHRDYLIAMQRALSIEAPSAGTFILQAASGNFVKKGHTLGVITP